MSQRGDVTECCTRAQRESLARHSMYSAVNTPNFQPCDHTPGPKGAEPVTIEQAQLAHFAVETTTVSNAL